MILSLVMAAAISLSPEDIEFDRVQVDWLMSFAHVEEALPENKLIPLKMLASKTYDKRQYGECWIEELGDDGVDVILWGARSKDLETATRCRRLLNILFRCKKCEGSGVCPACGGERPRDERGNTDYDFTCPEACDYQNRCRSCDGCGDTRLERLIGDNYAEKNLFRWGSSKDER